MRINHNFVSAKADSTDATLIQPSHWNDGHAIVDTSRTRSAWDYDFTAQLPGVGLTAGITNTITLTPVPVGINASNTNHYLYISGGTGTAEAVKITGGTAVSGAASGTITFVPANNHTGAWSIASATGGVQECLYDCWKNAYALVTKGSCFNFDNTARSNINLYAPVYFPPGWGNHYEFGGINFTLLLPTSFTDAFWIDSMDFCYISFAHCQMYWPGIIDGCSLIRLNPQNPQGEASTAITSSTFILPTVVPALVGGAPGSNGNGIRISALAPASVIAGNHISVAEINGGKYGIYVDNATATYGFNGNQIRDFYIHGQATDCIYVGSSGAAQTGNIFDGVIDGVSGNAVHSYAKHDRYLINIIGGTGKGFVFETGADNNLAMASRIGISGTVWTNSGVSNRLILSNDISRTDPVVGASPWTAQNLTGQPISMIISGVLDKISISQDGLSWIDTTTPPTNTFLTLLPDMYFKIQYSGATPFVSYIR